MVQKIRNPELKTFIQDSVEDCYQIIDQSDFGNYNRNNGNNRNQRGNAMKMCEWAKTFAMCLEDRGKDVSFENDCLLPPESKGYTFILKTLYSRTTLYRNSAYYVDVEMITTPGIIRQNQVKHEKLAYHSRP